MPFIPYDPKRADLLRQEMSRHQFFKDPETFISIYNQGFLNKKDSEIANILSAISDTFKDVKVTSRGVTMLSDGEVYLEDAVSKLNAWISAIKFKHEIQDFISAGVINEDSTLYVYADDRTVTLREVGENENGERFYIADKDKALDIKLNVGDFNAIKSVPGTATSGDDLVVNVRQVLALSDEFAKHVSESIPTIQRREQHNNQ